MVLADAERTAAVRLQHCRDAGFLHPCNVPFRQVLGSPKSRKTFWGEEAQRNERALAMRGGERYGACADDSAGCRVPFTKGGPAGESTAVDRGSAPPGVSGRRSGQALPAAPSESPRHFAAPRAESVIVGYYTAAEVIPETQPVLKTKKRRRCPWQETTGSIAPSPEIAI